jgi:hypothetical protein
MNTEQSKNSKIENLFCASRFDREECLMMRSGNAMMRGGSAGSASPPWFSRTGSTGRADNILEPRDETGARTSRSIGPSRGRGGQGRRSGGG